MALRRLKECIEELHGSDNAINLECMTTSARTNPNCPASKEYIKWDEVRDFLLMAEEALRAKDLAAQRAVEEAHNLGSSDEVDFLLQEIGKISEERSTLQQRVQELMRANQSLTEEITIIRAHMEAAENAVLLSPGFPPSEGQHCHQLAAAEEKGHAAALENALGSLKIEMESLQTKNDLKDESKNSPRILAGKNTNRKKKKSNRKKS